MTCLLVGTLGASRSVFAVNQDMSYGVALLMTGSSNAAADIVLDIFRQIQPTLDRVLANEIAVLYSGTWYASDGESEITVKVHDGSLWITKLWLNGTDVLRLTQGNSGEVAQNTTPITLWSAGRHHEFRRVVEIFMDPTSSRDIYYTEWSSEHQMNSARCHMRHVYGTGPLLIVDLRRGTQWIYYISHRVQVT